MKQPDFRKLFYDHFGGVPRKITYSVREDSNRYHDMVFLCSLVHDARFKMSEVALKAKRMTIPLNRDCWELGFLERKSASELYIADSKLTITPVLSIEWQFPHGLDFHQSELWVDDVWLSRESEGETRNLEIRGHGWGCIVTLTNEDIRIHLADQESPHLYSEKKKK